MAVLIASNGGVAERLERTAFTDEKSMRDMLLRNPDMIPVYEIDEDIRLLAIKRELRVPESDSDKFADAVAVDKNGSIYLIETKLFTNSDKRRVVAQVLSYGASLWASSQSSGQFLDILNESCLDLFNKEFLDYANDFFSFADGGLESFKDSISKNWDDGVFKFVVYMDQVGDDLKNLVTYINKRSKFDLYLVGVDYYQQKDVEIIIPKLYGVPDRKEVEIATSKKSQGSSGMTSEEFLRSAEIQLGQEYPKFVQLFSSLRRSSGDDNSYRANSYGGAYTPRFANLKNAGPFSLKADGTLQIYLNYLEDKGLIEVMSNLLDRLKAEGFIPTDVKSRQPMIKISTWSDKIDALAQLISDVGQKQ